MKRISTAVATLAFAVGAASTARAQAPPTANSIGIELVLIQPGTMTVGRYTPKCPPLVSATPDSLPAAGVPATRGGARRTPFSPEELARCEEMAAASRQPGFTVRIEHPFYIGKYEVTQEQWTKVMGKNPSVFQGAKVKDDAGKHPVDSVTWQDAQRFIARLNQMEKTTAYRLPTEFEWEYAARAGSDEEIPWSQIAEYAWYWQVGGGRGRGGPAGTGAPTPAPAPPGGATAPPGGRPAPLLEKATTQIVGLKKPNAWGLYDVVGNVWEWVADWYNDKQFADPIPPRSGQVRVLKGASFSVDQIGAHPFFHAGGPADGFDVGFRIVKDVGAR
jgi:formylglycine-generating enzyme required for sulfatase activity